VSGPDGEHLDAGDRFRCHEKAFNQARLAEHRGFQFLQQKNLAPSILLYLSRFHDGSSDAPNGEKERG
jgi:hypothetical protein